MIPGLLTALLLAAPLSSAPFTCTGPAYLTDDSHPNHPGDFRRYDVTFRFHADPRTGEAVIECESGEGVEKDTDRYFWRRGRIFQADENNAETPAGPLGDLSPATLAALHPALVTLAMEERRDAVRSAGRDRYLFAWNDELWTVATEGRPARPRSLERRVFHDLYGDGVEIIRYDASSDGSFVTTVNLRGRETARLDVGVPAATAPPVLPVAANERDRARLIAPEEIVFTERAPSLFTIDLVSMSTRVTVAEFDDFVFVIEGVYNARNGDLVVESIRNRFKKPVRYFSFSHLHGQYIGSVRSYVYAGATVLVPPTTQPMVEQLAKADHDLRPDALARDHKRLLVEAVKERWQYEDDTNTIDIYNIPSGHTDEYLVFYFPRQKVLLTGDLLFFRPEKPLTGRSKQLCGTLAKLDVDVDAYWATWPLEGYGTRNVVTGDEMRAKCAEP